MCLIVFGWQAHADYDLVVAANRDERHARSTRAAHWWNDFAWVFGGRDLEAGGGWCAIDRAGRFAAVTNVREPGQNAAPRRSRGRLVRDFLADRIDAGDWADRVAATGAEYGPFNLLVGDRAALWFVSNRGAVRHRRLHPGVHAISNGHWGDHWPKTDRAEADMKRVLAADTPSPSRLFDSLADTDPAPVDRLPDTGVGTAFERFLSPAFIRSARYGTRASTVIRRSRDGRVDFHERSFDADARPTEHVDEHFRCDTERTA